MRSIAEHPRFGEERVLPHEVILGAASTDGNVADAS
jgi:hypothetical protein